MTQSIITRYHGPTNTRPSRYSAVNSSKSKRIFVNANYALNGTVNQAFAAQTLAKAIGWHGRYVGGALNDKGDMVWVEAVYPPQSVV